MEWLTGSAGELHSRELPEPPARRVSVMEVTKPAVVLGSTQPDSLVDHDAAGRAGLDVVRRRSGGGAVLLVPGESVWVDVVIPPNDGLWDNDVGRAFQWLGTVWASVLADHGLAGDVHEGALCVTEWSRLVCFGGLGPGEVTVDGRKAVGMAQRRGRAGTRFQCIVHSHWDPARLVSVLDLPPAARTIATAALAGRVAEVPANPRWLVDRLTARLP